MTKPPHFPSNLSSLNYAQLVNKMIKLNELKQNIEESARSNSLKEQVRTIYHHNSTNIHFYNKQ